MMKKIKRKKINKKTILSIIGLILLLTGTAMGVYLVQKNQDIREKASTDCTSYKTSTECEAHKSENCAWYICTYTPENAACRTVGTSTEEVCCNGNYGSCGKTCSSPNVCMCYDENGYICSETGPTIKCGDNNTWGQCGSTGGCPTGQKCKTLPNGLPGCLSDPSCSGGGGGGTGSCGNGSATNCVGKNPGDKCKGDKICKDTGQKGQDGKAKCSCSESGGGGGGGGGGSSPSPSPCSGGSNNPSTFSASKSGRLIIYYHVTGTGGTPLQVALKVNSSTCSLTDNTKVVDLTDNTTGKMETDLDVSSGQTVCFGAYYNQGSNAAYGEPVGNTCGSDLDISANVTQAETDNGTGSIVSKQCWTNDPNYCDYNDFALLFAVGGGGVSGNGLKLRFQGITKKALDQSIFASFLSGGSSVWSNNEIKVSNDDSGVYTMDIPGEVSAGTYDLLIKGPSHLQKRYSNLVYNGNNQPIDLSQTEAYQCRAGDVNGDNAITIDDVSQVSLYYTDFAVPVNVSDPKMVSSDINKDGKITIQDLALISINWSDFKVEGDK